MARAYWRNDDRPNSSGDWKTVSIPIVALSLAINESAASPSIRASRDISRNQNVPLGNLFPQGDVHPKF